MQKGTTRLEAHFSGRVQGVGFRYTTSQVARGFMIVGRVSNLPDGRVHLQAEGEKQELEAFLAEVQLEMEGYIRQTDVRWNEPSGEFRGFTIH